MNKYDTVNDLYNMYGKEVSGMFHNMLWQILINESCSGAFTNISAATPPHTVGVALCEGGYVPTGVSIEHLNKDRQAEILDDLNERVFGLTPEGAEKVVIESFKQH